MTNKTPDTMSAPADMRPIYFPHLRWMIRRDLEEVLAIENDVFEFPWKEDDFYSCLRQKNCIGMVACESGATDAKVVGFFIYELHRTQLHVLSFAVARANWRQGIGRKMIAKLISKLSPERRKRILLEVRETNLSAQLFFRAHGFHAISTIRDFYDDTSEDAYLMQYRLPLEARS